MKVTLLGTGTSGGVPSLGCSCEVCRSTDPHDKRLRSAAMIETENTRILIDAGPDIRQQLLDRNEDQTAYSQPEHSLALTFGEIADRCILLGRNLRHHEFALQHGLKDEGRNHHGNHRRDEDFGDNAGSSNQSLVPEHDGGNIADW